MVKAKSFGKRITTGLLAALLALTVLLTPQMNVQAAKNQANAIAIGIDVSAWQGNIDWAQVAAAGVQFAFIRVGTSSGVDKFFHKNMAEANAVGIRTGVYIYTHATNPQEAYADAVAVATLIEPYTISMPVVIDIEDKRQQNLSPEMNAAICAQYCAVIESAGYFPMIYSSRSWFKNRIAETGYGKWVAQWADSCGADDALFWQASCTGRIPGIAGDVDVDYQFVDLSSVIIANGFLERKGNIFYYANYKMVRNHWIEQEGARYYVGPTGAMLRNMFAQIGDAFYAFDAEGKMMTGWRDLGDGRYYFGTDGKMARGLVKIGEHSYLFDDHGRLYTGLFNNGEHMMFFDTQDGHMAVGVTAIGNEKFYFDENGYQKAGWLTMSGQEYYFDPTTGGALAHGFVNDGTGIYYTDPTSAAKRKGIVEIGNDTYYFHPTTGAMQVGIVEIGGGRYYFAADGKLTTGLVSDGTYYYYFDPATRVQMTGFIKIDNDYYYFDPQTGQMQFNVVAYFNGIPFQVGADGKVILQ